MKYTVICAYNDCTCATEQTDDICAALPACAIYLAAPDCFTAKIVDNTTDELVMTYWRR